MRNFANQCGATIPTSLRGTMLCKHIATHTALLNVEETQAADLANFMRHDKRIHKDVYRMLIPFREMTDDSRLLEAAMGNDDESENEESDDDAVDPDDPPLTITAPEENPLKIVPEVVSGNKNIVGSDNTSDDDVKNDSPRKCSANSSTGSKRRSTSLYGKTKRSKWSEDEKKAVTRHFGKLSALRRLPSLQDCHNVIQKYKVLGKRQPQLLKTWTDNQRKAKKRKEAYMLSKMK